MVIEYKNFDEKVKEAFNGFEAKPPASVWHGVFQGMAAPTPRRLAPVLLRIAAGFAIFLLGSISVWFLAYNPSTDSFSLATLEPAKPNAVSIENISPGFSEPDTKTKSLLVSESTLTALSIFSNEAEILYPVEPTPFPSLKTLPALLAELPQEAPVLLAASIDINQEISSPDDGPGFIASLGKRIDITFLSLGVNVGPQYSYRQLSNPVEVSKAGIPFQTLESPLFTYYIGMSANVKISPRLSLQSGLGYSTMGQFVSDIIAFSHPANFPLFEMGSNSRFGHPQTIVTSQGNIRLSEPTLFFADAQSYRVVTNKQFFANGDPKNLTMRDFGISQYFSFIEVPILAQYRVLDLRTANLSLKAGGAMNYLIGNEVFLGRKTMQKSIGETYGVRKYNFSVIGGMVLTVPLRYGFSLTFEPTAQMYLMPMVQDQLMIGRALPFQYSLYSGITYGF